MSLILSIFCLLLGVFGLFYTFLILFYTIGWYRLRTFRKGDESQLHTRCSVIVPARNEENNIPHLLQDLSRQDLTHNLFEVIVVDDHSSDNTARQVTRFAEENPGLNLRLIRLTSDQKTFAFKKKAIEEAIGEAEGDLIITTDADCRVGKKWLETILSFYEAEKPRMIVGPVSFHNEKDIFDKIQTEEFLSLISITGGAIRMQRPIMCNGANLAYEKKAFHEAGGFKSHRFSSGDDVFLMLQVRKMFGNRSIRFLKSREAIAFTEPKKRISDFFQQRTRWASKNKGYEANILAVSITVYMMNLLLVAGMVLAFFRPEFRSVLLTTLVIKVLVDFPILIGIGNFVKRPGLILYSIPLIILYPFYIVIVGALGMMGNYRWKGRKVKN